jgi:hypothetical protein
LSFAARHTVLTSQCRLFEISGLGVKSRCLSASAISTTRASAAATAGVIYGHVVPDFRGHVLNDSALHRKPVAAAGVGVHLKLEGLHYVASRRLVVHDHQVLRRAIHVVVNLDERSGGGTPRA